MTDFHINTIQDLEKLSFEVTWQYFEKLVEFIFEQNGFDVQQNIVLTNNGDKRQYDVIAKKKEITYVVECKRWKSRASVVSAIKDAVDIHIDRGRFYSILHPEEQVQPLLVMPLQGMPEQHNEVYIVPLVSLNWFLNN